MRKSKNETERYTCTKCSGSGMLSGHDAELAKAVENLNSYASAIQSILEEYSDHIMRVGRVREDSPITHTLMNRREGKIPPIYNSRFIAHG